MLKSCVKTLIIFSLVMLVNGCGKRGKLKQPGAKHNIQIEDSYENDTKPADKNI